MDVAREVANAVLYEGYLLYPYRASANKNQIRWQWGVLMPPAYAAAGHGEHASSHSEFILEPGTDPVLQIRLRFLQVLHRSGGDGPVPEFDEAVSTLEPWLPLSTRAERAVLLEQVQTAHWREVATFELEDG